MARYTRLYAVHDQDSKAGRTFISDSCSRRSSKHAMVSCVVNFVNYLQSVSVSLLMENVLILFCGGGGEGVDISWKPTAAPTSQKKIKAFMNPYLTIEISSRSI